MISEAYEKLDMIGITDPNTHLSLLNSLHIKLSPENLKGTYNIEDLGTDWRIAIKLLLHKRGIKYVDRIQVTSQSCALQMYIF
jgi:hypothetical protein